MKKNNQSLHQELVQTTELVRLAYDNLEANRFSYIESPTDANQRRVYRAKCDYLIAVEARKSVLARLSELESTGDYPW